LLYSIRGRTTARAVILGQSGFLDTFTVTFGPDGFALEPASVFRRHFLPANQ